MEGQVSTHNMLGLVHCRIETGLQTKLAMVRDNGMACGLLEYDALLTMIIGVR